MYSHRQKLQTAFISLFTQLTFLILTAYFCNEKTTIFFQVDFYSCCLFFVFILEKIDNCDNWNCLTRVCRWAFRMTLTSSVEVVVMRRWLRQ